jgi:hypothetical protein
MGRHRQPARPVLPDHPEGRRKQLEAEKRSFEFLLAGIARVMEA